MDGIDSLTVNLFQRSTRENWSCWSLSFGIKRGKQSKTYVKYFFWVICSFFESNLLASRAKQSPHYFLKIDGIDLLKVNLFKRSTRAIRSQSNICSVHDTGESSSTNVHSTRKSSCTVCITPQIFVSLRLLLKGQSGEIHLLNLKFWLCSVLHTVEHGKIETKFKNT